MNPDKKTIFSGIAPSGTIHIGNYLGAIKQWVKLQNDYRSIFCIVDLHAISVPQDPKKLRQKILEVAMMYFAAGIDPEKSIIFIQSHNQDHAELGWILNTFTPLGELERMTQFKEKKAAIEKRHGALAGLLTYPTLMASDILLYQTHAVPVGEDQLQHIELTRSLAQRFNNKFGETFRIPAPFLAKTGARIMALDDPKKKMSKSAQSPSNYIALGDSPEEILKKIKSAVTDSGNEIVFDEEKKPAVSNLLTIYSSFAEKPIADIEKMYNQKGYAEFKKDLAEVVIEGLRPFQKRLKELQQDQDALFGWLKRGADRAREISQKTLIDVKEKIGLIA